MTINFTPPQMTELKPRIIVIGVGGAGGNAVNNMINSGLDGVEFLVANTDSQALAGSKAERIIQLGKCITQGLGCGARPEIGRQAAEEAIDQILDHLQGTHMVFVTAGMGGGTGTGAAPVIAQACREQNILTVGVVTKPFQFEGSHRMAIAEQGIEELQKYVDTLIIIPNQNLFRVANEKTTFADAFAMADQVLHSGVRGITDLMVMPGLINLDFADVKTVMSEMGKAMMGTGEAEGDKRAIDAAEAAISNPLLDDVSMKGARGVLINISGGMDLTLFEVDEAANRIRQEVDPNANIIVGSALDDQLNGRMRVSVVATGIDIEAAAAGRPANAAVQLRAVGSQRPGRPSAEEERSRQEEPVVVQQMVEGTPVNVAVAASESHGSAADWNAARRPAAERNGEVAAHAESGPFAAGHRHADAGEGASVASVASGISAAVHEAVPQPKPLTPERDLLGMRPAENREISREPFIMPKPAAPASRGARVAEPQPLPETSAGDGAARRGKGRSLFARMTGGTRAASSAPAEADPAPQARFEPRPAQERPEPAASLRPRFSPQEQAERLPRPQQQPQEEDLLEIPSFLRRQAN